jgi:ribosome-associated protein
MARYDSSVNDANIDAGMKEERVSKTRRKQEMHALQALGAALVEIPDAQLASMQLPEKLAHAVREAKSISSHEGRRRQVQYIGRLMREIDPEPIRARLAEIEGSSATATARHRRMEQWRARLVEDDAALTEFARAHPAADLQALRALIRNARREQKEGRPPRAFRELYRVLRAASGDAELPEPDRP